MRNFFTSTLFKCMNNFELHSKEIFIFNLFINKEWLITIWEIFLPLTFPKRLLPLDYFLMKYLFLIYL